MNITTTITVKETLQCAKNGIAYIDKVNNKKWDIFIKKELDKQLKYMFFGLIKLKQRSYSEMEDLHGKGLTQNFDTEYNWIFNETKQQQMYKNIVEMAEHNIDKEITIKIEDYNCLMTFGDK